MLDPATSGIREPLNRGRIAILWGLVLLSGCTAASRGGQSYAYGKSEPPLTISWNYFRGPGIVVAEGIARNDLPRKFQFVDVRATLVGLDQAHRVVSRSITRVPDFVGPETPFRVELRLSGAEQALDLRFEYWTEDIETDGRQ